MSIKKYIGDRRFYKTLLIIALPIILQNGITNFVNLLDNIMVGQVGTEQMSGVAIANQLIFVFNLCIFGGVSGAGIFTAQFFGYGDDEGVRQTFRFKLCVCAGITAIFMVVFGVFGNQLISLYLHDTDAASDLAATLYYGRRYLLVMMFGMPAFALTHAYAGTLRETGHTILPMVAGVAAVFINLFFNWLLIFGNWGMPKMGVIGAAVATVISRYVELLTVTVFVHVKSKDYPFIQGAYRHFRIEASLAENITKRGLPLLFNELLWSVGMTAIIQCYSMRGLTAVAAVNISSTMLNLLNTVVMAMGNSIAIIVGNQLGANKMDEAKDTVRKLIFTSVSACIVIGAIFFAVSPLIPRLYNTTDDVKALATVFLKINAALVPIMAISNCCYFTLRSGGKTLLTFIFDSAFVWCICLPPAFITAYFTSLGVITIYVIIQSLECVKALYGLILVKKGIWLNNIVAKA